MLSERTAWRPAWAVTVTVTVTVTVAAVAMAVAVPRSRPASAHAAVPVTANAATRPGPAIGEPDMRMWPVAASSTHVAAKAAALSARQHRPVVMAGSSSHLPSAPLRAGARIAGVFLFVALGVARATERSGNWCGDAYDF
ncbi:hypothetical protein ACF1BP_27585 [Streptomyces sp. NPDC014735]|uniref:hypothetical protein n=1 Tax=unclassified Streptomyces TaxID=2593676 RepID=UPI003702009D